jgi:glycosyltransferase involved in cell wall biosynthesis
MSTCSLVIPVYRNRESLPELVEQIRKLAGTLPGPLEAVFVVDGSPDDSHAWLQQNLPGSGLAARLILLARNFGSFAATRAGLAAARGDYFAVMAADLQEPPELVAQFFAMLATDEVDVVVGTRTGRHDPLLSRLASRMFWSLYRRIIQPQVPPGGVDMFGCNRAFRDKLVALDEANTSLVALIFWLGHRRRTVPYVRLPRRHGRSAWTLRRKLKYLSDSVFAFTDLPVRLLFHAGTLGLLLSLVLGLLVLVERMRGGIELPGYSATVLIILFFGALNTFGLGIVGAYAWRAYENTKQRPGYVVLSSETIGGQERS